MKILVNSFSARRGGSLIFIKNLLHHLALMFPDTQYDVLLSEDQSFFVYKTLPDNVKIIFFKTTKTIIGRLWVEQFHIPRLLKNRKYDCFFQVDDTLPPLIYLRRGVKTLCVFHASIQFLLPHEIGDHFLKILYWRFLKTLALKYVTTPVTVSHCAKGELAQGKGPVFKKMQVIYHGIDHGRFNLNPSKELTIPIVLPVKYVLSVSTRNPHKNYYRLIHAYNQLVQSKRILEHFVLIGNPVWASEETRIQRYIHEQGISGRVHIFDALDNSHMPQIYRGARAYIYASLFDSFGFTPLEAMACGVPCVVSALSALPEICGDAAEYFNPLDVASIAVALGRVLEDETRREELITLGLKHVKKFTWETAAQEYHRLLTSESAPIWCV